MKRNNASAGRVTIHSRYLGLKAAGLERTIRPVRDVNTS